MYADPTKRCRAFLPTFRQSWSGPSPPDWSWYPNGGSPPCRHLPRHSAPRCVPTPACRWRCRSRTPTPPAVAAGIDRPHRRRRVRRRRGVDLPDRRDHRRTGLPVGLGCRAPGRSSACDCPRGPESPGWSSRRGVGAAVPDCRSDERFASQIAIGTGYIPITMVVVPLMRRKSRDRGAIGPRPPRRTRLRGLGHRAGTAVRRPGAQGAGRGAGIVHQPGDHPASIAPRVDERFRDLSLPASCRLLLKAIRQGA